MQKSEIIFWIANKFQLKKLQSFLYIYYIKDQYKIVIFCENLQNDIKKGKKFIKTYMQEESILENKILELREHT